MSLIKTERLFDDGDVNTQQVLMMIDKGIKKNLSRVMTERGIRARRIYKKLKPLQYIVYLAMIFLSFFEKPHWCIIDDRISETIFC